MIWLYLSIALIALAECQALADAREEREEVVHKPDDVFRSSAWLREWRKVRYEALVRDGGRCQCCGRTAQDGVRIEVDHCKPKSKYPLLSLELSNLAVLCGPCNRSKSNVDETNWRTLNCR